MTGSSLPGAWTLNEWIRLDASAGTSHPFTPRVVGRIIYAPEGVMGGFLMHPLWTSTANADPKDPARFIAYSGRWAMGAGNTVEHHVDIASQPSWVGIVLRRHAMTDADRLVLSTQPDPRDGGASHRLSFSRARG